MDHRIYKDFLSVDFICLLVINFFISNIYFSICLIPVFFIFWPIFNIFLTDIDEGLAISIVFASVVSKLVLPIFYYFLEKKSKNPTVQKFIFNLKTNWKWRLITLFLVFFYPLSKIDKNLSSFLENQMLGSGFISYVVLFIWWDLLKLINKFKNKTNKIQII